MGKFVVLARAEPTVPRHAIARASAGPTYWEVLGLSGVMLGALLACGGSGEQRTVQAAGGISPKQGSEADLFSTDKPAYYAHQCEKGQGNICYLLGGNFERGGDTPWGFFPQDYARAVAAYSNGCSAGDVDSCGAKANLLIAGKPVRNVPEGTDLARGTCERGHADSCGLFGMVQATTSTSLSQYEDGLRQVERGCSAGGLRACSFLKGFRTKVFATVPRPIEALGIRLSGPPRELASWCADHGYAVDSDATGINCRRSDGFIGVRGSFENQELRAILTSTLLDGDANDWAMALKGSVWKLSDRYGVPSDLVVRGARCAPRALAEQFACLESGEIHLEAKWLWEAGAAVALHVTWNRQLGPLLLNHTTLLRVP